MQPLPPAAPDAVQERRADREAALCLDTATGSYADAPRDGSANLDGPRDVRILRGGSWSHNPAICRSAYRDGIAVSERGWQGRIGFRAVCPMQV